MPRRASLARLWISCAVLAGCTGTGPASSSVSVKYKGESVSNVHVCFHRPGSRDALAIGTTDSSGILQLHTPGGHPATLDPGRYKVTVQNTGEPTWSFPLKYLDPSKTPLLVEVSSRVPIEILIP